MPLFYIPIPLTTEKLEGLKRLVAAPDFNIQIYVELDGNQDNQEHVVASLKEVLVQAIIAVDVRANGSKN